MADQVENQAAPVESGQSKREEKKEARDAFSLLLKRLRSFCKIVDRIEDWQKTVAEVEGLLDKYGDVIPAEKAERIRAALELPKATMEAVTQSCRVLQSEIKGLVSYLGAVPAAASLLAGGVIVAAVVVFGLTLLSNLLAVDITVANQGCGDLPVSQAIEDTLGSDLAGKLPLGAVGIALPAEIKDNSSEVLSLPPVDLRVAYQADTGLLLLDVYGRNVPIPVGNATEVLFDDVSIFGSQSDIDLGSQKSHELVIHCEG